MILVVHRIMMYVAPVGCSCPGLRIGRTRGAPEVNIRSGETAFELFGSVARVFVLAVFGVVPGVIIVLALGS